MQELFRMNGHGDTWQEPELSDAGPTSAAPAPVPSLVDTDIGDRLALLARLAHDHLSAGHLGPFHIHLASTLQALYAWAKDGELPDTEADDYPLPGEWFGKRRAWANELAAQARTPDPERRTAEAVAHMCRAACMGDTTDAADVLAAAQRRLGLALAS